GVEAGDAVDAQQRRVLLVRGGRAETADDGVTLAQVIATDLVDRDVDVIGRRVVALGAQETVAVVAQVQQSFDLDDLAGVGLVGVGHGVAAEALAAVTVAAVAAVASGGVVAEVARLGLLSGVRGLERGGP